MPATTFISPTAAFLANIKAPEATVKVLPETTAAGTGSKVRDSRAWALLTPTAKLAVKVCPTLISLVPSLSKISALTSKVTGEPGTTTKAPPNS